jgi:hypothetical protein
MQISSALDVTAKPFQIGLKPLPAAQWIAPPRDLAAYLAEKHLLWRAVPGTVFMAEPGTDAAQTELLAHLVAHLTTDHAANWRRDGKLVTPAGSPAIDLTDDTLPALLRAAFLVPDDLVLMRRGDDGWRLAAASLSFPSAWSLNEKFGRPMHEVHAPVPGFAAGTRNVELITRMFDNLRPETPMIRWNWSLFGDDRLHHPEGGHPQRPRFGDGTRASHAFLRVERQTLTRLPLSRDIVFSIGIHVDPLDALARLDDGAIRARALYEQIAGLSAEQVAYKGLTLERDLLLARLSDIAVAAG